jgi:anti-sigma regulatory factor (Ser/Thr protein kinase)
MALFRLKPAPLRQTLAGMARLQIAPLTPWITEAAVLHGDDLPTHLMHKLDISRRRAGTLLNRLVQAQWLRSVGTPRRAGYLPGALRQVVKRYALQGLQEDLPWRCDFHPFLDLPPELRRMAQHAFTELLNNAIDHSGGSSVTVSMRQTPLQLQLLVSDDGCGVFERIARSFEISDPQLAMLELSKGKLTSQPERHSGHGLFFTSRLADVFDIHANAAAFQCRSWDRRRWHAGRPAAKTGTSVYLAINIDSQRTLDGVLREHSHDRASYGFERTVVPLQLVAGDGVGLVSRADAKRVASGLSRFRRAEIDFNGVADIGHGFADELFRVFQSQHPGLEIVPMAMQPRVAAMVSMVIGSVFASADRPSALAC